MSGGGSSPYENWTDRDIVDLIAEFPLAWVVSAQPSFGATLLPMMVETDDAGRPASLIGHLAKRNPQVDQMRANPRTLFLFLGPHGYVSPELVTTTRNWGPTWNYASVRIVADVALDEDLNDEALARLVSKMEQGRREPWQREELGERYSRMKNAIVAFRAQIVSLEGKFKLGQDERDEVFADIVSGLAGTDLADWMRRFNDGR